ncbi:PIG-L deacetylase family protein [Burkholderia stagnalis]
MSNRLLVVAAHPGDFVWRAAGTILRHRANGEDVKVVCLSYGVMGEAGKLWSAHGATRATVKRARIAEAHAAADVLGVELDAFDLDDYPLEASAETTLRLNRIIRAFRPDAIVTHPPVDPGNADHANTCEMVTQARVFASAPGHGADTVPPSSLFYFEPHQPELCDFKANLFVDISDVWARKRQAFECIASQQGVWAYYERVALQRGAQASRRATQAITHAEAFQRAFPAVASLLA